MTLSLVACPICGAAVMVAPPQDDLAVHKAWHDALGEMLAQLAGDPGETASSATLKGILADDALNPEDEDPPIGADELPASPPVDRHPQIPEDAWNELNAEQRADVADRMDHIAARTATIAEARNETDVRTARTYLERGIAGLREDYGIELLPAEDIEAADADVAEKPAPPRIDASLHARHAPPEVLRARKRFLLAKQGLPAELEADRRAELAEIDRRLAGV